MDLSFMSDYIVPVIFGICLCVGYIIKEVVYTDKINRFIPLIVSFVGLVVSIWMNGFTPASILIGLASGLASTGAYELYRNLIKKE